jgi:hypothetical protein
MQQAIRFLYRATGLVILRGVFFVELVVEGFVDQPLTLVERHYKPRIFVELTLSLEYAQSPLHAAYGAL